MGQLSWQEARLLHGLATAAIEDRDALGSGDLEPSRVAVQHQLTDRTGQRSREGHGTEARNTCPIAPDDTAWQGPRSGSRQPLPGRGEQGAALRSGAVLVIPRRPHGGMAAGAWLRQQPQHRL